jgi:hypothetical protein
MDQVCKIVGVAAEEDGFLGLVLTNVLDVVLPILDVVHGRFFVDYQLS